MKKTIRVAVPVPLYRCFDYIVDTDQPLAPGCRVVVPFGHRKLRGIVWHENPSAPSSKYRLKHVIEILDTEPVLDKEQMRLIQWLSDYYHYPIGETCATMMPNALMKGKPATLALKQYWRLSSQGQNDDESLLKRAPKQYALLQALKKHTVLCDSEIKAQFTAAVLKALYKKQLVECFSEAPALITNAKEPTLHQEQKEAVDAVTQSSGQFNTFLIDGVTGSGKTEVYLRCIKELLNKDQQALVLIPEISLTPQTIGRFQERFGNVCQTLHSQMTDKERLNVWLQAKAGIIKVVVGTRSAIFTPFKQLGMIIVDEEHDISFKQQEGLRYSARDLAIYRGQLNKTPVVLGSATPSLESLNNAKNTRYHYLQLKERATGAQKPALHIIDVRNKPLTQGLSKALIQQTKKHLANGKQILFFLNRRGYAPILMCQGCGWSAQCRHCNLPMTLHLKKHKLICHHCEYAYYQPRTCPNCQAEALTPIGLGTERLEQTLKSLFPSTDILRIDRDSVQKKHQLEQMLNKIHQGGAQILLGTQMLAKGHHFPNVTMVGILNMDHGFFSSDFRAMERMGQLITQVAGRAGREKHPGEVFIQTLQPDNPLLLTLIKKKYADFSEQLLKERQTCHLPPFAYFALCRASADHPDLPMDFLLALKKQLGNSATLLGPISSPMPKRAGNFRAQLLLTSPSRKALQHAASCLIEASLQLKTARKVRWSLDVDPQEMY
jgi:primosomal protein N' (replication factor Y) (superfamily II helicase)